MQPDQVVSLFDQQAAGYDRQWARTAAIRECLYLLLDPLLAPLRADAHVLCVGVGTGQEMAHLARRFPGWTFTAVEPSGAMLAACRARAEEEGFAHRCGFHGGFLGSLPPGAPFDAATCFLVSQFITDRTERTGFFRSVAGRLVDGGLLASSDLAADTGSADYEVLLPAWMRMMQDAEVAPGALERIRTAYSTDVAVLPPGEVEEIIAAGGFERPLRFFQAGLIHGWLSARSRVPQG